MKDYLKSDLIRAIEALKGEGVLSAETAVEPQLARTKDKAHGDFATNAALALAKAAGRPPRQLAQAIVGRLPNNPQVEKVEIAGPGFINFFLKPGASRAVIDTILEEGELYGRSTIGKGRKIQVEFVSANPTGPLHVGHGRGAAYGAAVASLLTAVGFAPQREYYVNDAGRQMDILAVSVWLRYLELFGKSLSFPVKAYRGDYLREIAADLKTRFDAMFLHSAAESIMDMPEDDPERQLDILIERCRQLLGEQDYREILEAGLDTILNDIRNDLAEFGVVYDCWFSERGLMNSGAVETAVARLRASGHTYEKDGALWFRSTVFGDEKDRVVVRENGQATYFASDIAYHIDKFERGVDQVIDVWGADHHGYAPRVTAAMQALGYAPDRVEILLVQFANLYRGEERVSMSTRAGEFVTLRELREEVGKDAARFFYVMRRSDQHLDFDLELAKSESADNPVYYIQYAFARVCSVFKQLEQKDLTYDPARGREHIGLLTENHEQILIENLARYPEVVEAAALAREPHQLTHYLRELANAFHTYYNAHQFLVENAGLRNARLNLISATRQVIANGLDLLGVSAPESM